MTDLGNLAPDDLDVILRARRYVPDDDADDFFAYVTVLLHQIGKPTVFDIRRVSNAALAMFGRRQ
jgi:hypothetical protein